MCLLRVLLTIALSLLVGCSSKEKRSTTLDERSEYDIPSASLVVGDIPDAELVEDKRLTVTVWEFDHTPDSKSVSGGREVKISLEIPYEQVRKTKKRVRR